MKIIFLFSLLLLFSVSCIQAPMQTRHRVRRVSVPVKNRTAIGMRKRIIILPFIAKKDSFREKVLEEAQRVFIARLTRSGRFVILTPQQFPGGVHKYYDEKNKSYKLDEMVVNAKKIGVTALIEGSLLRVKAIRVGDSIGVIRKIRANIDAAINMRVMAIKTKKMILSQEGYGKADAESTRVAEYSNSDHFLSEDPYLMQGAVNKAFLSKIPPILSMIDKLSWQGRVAHIEGDRVFINAGRLSGIQVGDVLKISDAGKDIYDPENGQFIGRPEGRMKGTIEVISYFGKDGALAVIHSGAGFLVNDYVDLY